MSLARFSLAADASAGALVDLAQAARRGLTAARKSIPCRFFYDDAGSQLFEEICALPEYYLTRAEDEILARHAAEIVACVPPLSQLVELGSGSSTKTRRLIEASLSRARSLTYVPIDISREMLEKSSRVLLEQYSGLSIQAIAAEYEAGLALLAQRAAAQKLILWLGSNVGNFDRREAARFVARLARSLRSEDRLAIGIDLRKPREILELAYDDPRGVTARFNKNLLARLNAELAADFDLSGFIHVARYDEVEGRIEMYLCSTSSQTVHLRAIPLKVEIGEGELIHTENSYKYSSEEIEALARAAGMRVERTWFDGQRRFSLSLFRPA